MAEGGKYLPLPKGFATTAIHTAQNPEEWGNAVIPPISISSTYKRIGPGDGTKYEYSRTGNPTRDTLEKVIATLECGKYGICSSSGLGAVTTVMGLLKQGDHLICVEEVYGGTDRLIKRMANNYGIELTFSGVDVADFEKALKPNTKMIWVETPSNPTLKVCDIEGVAELAKKNKVILVIDNTFLTPYFQRPLTLGADIVMHSLSKYLSGHSDIIMGAVVTSDEKLHQEMRFLQHTLGVVPSPFDCYLVLRSLKTLSLRMEQHSKSSLKIAKYFEGHPKIEKLIHPGLSSHPQHNLAKKQTSGHSGMMSMYLKGNLETSKRFLSSLKIFTTAGSLGNSGSLIELPCLISHNSVPLEQREKMGITDNLVRMSIGLEDTDDLIADLDQALAVI
ncbi:hypothetical protein HHI36_018959 [Cryptolaemus montrouzieri]|uniref:cystathionine gamma-lyase n=1 Tax=Cryptolaemus montrouzieri TaxID=559131 RepID=A0ABD2P209_9CUCU